MGSSDINLIELDRDQHDLLPVNARLRENLPACSCDETLAPKLNPRPADRRLNPDTIDRRDITTVGDRVAALDRFPSAMLVYAVFGFFLRMPAYGRGVKRISAPCIAVSRAPSGYHWSQQMSTPIFPNLVFHARNPVSPGVK